LLQYPRSTPDGFKKIVFNEFKKWFSASEVKVILPCIYSPPRSMKFGFFGHKGDSFREMIDLWAEKGYIERKEESSITHCWFGSIGAEGTLLYDRPTWNWLDKASENEQVYKKCLAGNPIPSEKPNAVSWTFWPRQPRMLELLAPDYSKTNYNEREDLLVFFGRIENEDQGKWRKDISGWQTLCSKFSMPVGAKEPYVYEADRYLKALASSKYGLCLRGYGPKCNREIELLAMGTVPVVVEGVDMDNYSEPLVEGIHYLRVKDSDDARDKIASIKESEWETMSKAGHQWWKQNASVDGSWSVTKALLESKA
jgi:hypothetical protein